MQESEKADPPPSVFPPARCIFEAPQLPWFLVKGNACGLDLFSEDSQKMNTATAPTREKLAHRPAPKKADHDAIVKAIGEIDPDGLKEVTYRCANDGCDNEQVIRFFANLPTLQATCCVKCRGGFGRDVPTMLEHRIGMFPVEGSERRFSR